MANLMGKTLDRLHAHTASPWRHSTASAASLPGPQQERSHVPYTYGHLRIPWLAYMHMALAAQPGAGHHEHQQLAQPASLG